MSLDSFVLGHPVFPEPFIFTLLFISFKILNMLFKCWLYLVKIWNEHFFFSWGERLQLQRLMYCSALLLSSFYTLTLFLEKSQISLPKQMIITYNTSHNSSSRLEVCSCGMAINMFYIQYIIWSLYWWQTFHVSQKNKKEAMNYDYQIRYIIKKL